MPPKPPPTVQEILEAAPVSLRQIEAKSKELGTPLSYETLQSWNRPRRETQTATDPDQLDTLATVLDALGADARRAAAQARRLAVSRRSAPK